MGARRPEDAPGSGDMALAVPSSRATSTASWESAGALAADLAPDGALTWYFPNVTHGHGRWGGRGNRYTRWWSDSLDVARHLLGSLNDLTRQTRLYHEVRSGRLVVRELIFELPPGAGEVN